MLPFHVQETSDGRVDTMQQFHVQGHAGIVTVGFLHLPLEGI